MHFSRCAILSFILFLLPCVVWSDSERGGRCFEPGQTYHRVTDISKTPWEVNAITAVPPGTVAPESWTNYAAFQERVLTLLGPNRTPPAFAAACGYVLPEYFTDAASVLVTFRRTIETTYDVLECNSGEWMLTTVETMNIPDVSDWLHLQTEPFNVADSETASLIHQTLESRLTSLSVQPGAESLSHTEQ